MTDYTKLEMEVERKSVRRGLAIGLGAFFGILMLSSMMKANISTKPIWSIVCAIFNGLLMIMFISTSQSRR